MVIDGLGKEAMIKYIGRYIYTAADLGGISLGVLCIAADFLGAIGFGTGIVLAVTIIYGYFEEIAKNQ